MAPQLGLQRHLASKGAPKGFQGVPKVSKRTTKITRAIVNINDGKRKIDFLTLFWDFQKLSRLFSRLRAQLFALYHRGMVLGVWVFKGFFRGGFLCFFWAVLGEVKNGNVFLRKQGSDLVAQTLVKAILHRNLRSIIWAWSQGKGFWRGRGNLVFSWLFGGVKNGKNMKMQDEHCQILVSRALDPCKMIS